RDHLRPRFRRESGDIPEFFRIEASVDHEFGRRFDRDLCIERVVYHLKQRIFIYRLARNVKKSGKFRPFGYQAFNYNGKYGGWKAAVDRLGKTFYRTAAIR